MTKKIYLIIPVLFLLIGIVSAEIPIFRQNEIVNYRFRCLDEDGNFCVNSVNCQINVELPNGTNGLDNESMSFNPTFFNITLPTNQFRTYPTIIMCFSENISISEFNYIVTADGREVQIFPTQFVIILLGFALIAVSLLNGRLRIFKYMGSIMILIMGVLTLFPGYSFINYTTLLGKVIGFTLIGMGFYFLIEDSFSRDEQTETFEQGEEE